MAGNTFPRLHNAMWPGLVGKGGDAEPPIGLDTMLEMTAATQVDGVRFDGVDLFLADPHTSIDASRDHISRLASKVYAHGLAIGSLVAPVWPPVGGGSAMGNADERKRFVTMVEKACRIGRQLRDMGVRPSGVVRIDSASGVHDWAADPAANQKQIAATFKEACNVAEDMARNLLPKAKSAGAACIAGSTWSSSWK